MTHKCDPHKPTDCSIKRIHFNYYLISLKHFISLACLSTLWCCPLSLHDSKHQGFTPIFLAILFQVSSLNHLSLTILLLVSPVIKFPMITLHIHSQLLYFHFSCIFLQLSILNFSLYHFYQLQAYMAPLRDSSDIHIWPNPRQTDKKKHTKFQYISISLSWKKNQGN